MVFSSLPFMLIFLPAVLLIYFVILRGRTARNVFLSIASLFFYAWGEPWFVLVMLGSILLNYCFGLLVGRHRENTRAAKAAVALAVVVNMGLLFVFKYLTFILTNIKAAGNFSFEVPQILLPIGISFFTFQALSYVIDVYRGKGKMQTNPLNVCLYVSFFPQLIAGPIVRYETVAEEIQNRRENWADFTQGVSRFIVGFGKKVLLSNTLAVIVSGTFRVATASGGLSGTDPATLSVGQAWLGGVAFALQLYFDFSGYSDMAIGLGRMFGFHFLENFDYPFISRSITEFYRRWHISLGTWFRDYLYIPLGGSRRGELRSAFNLFVVWLVTGFWHGANWTFVTWGLFTFVFIMLEKYLRLHPFMQKYGAIGWLYTMVVFVCSAVIFNSPTLADSISYLGSMFGLNGNPLIDNTFKFYVSQNLVVICLSLIFATPVAKYAGKLLQKRPVTARIANILYPVVMAGILVVSMSFLVKGVYNPFIYFNF